MKVEKRVQEFICKERLFAADAGILVGLSGGADSVALLRMLVRMGYRCHAVHCNFHLRGDESNRDEQFATGLCHMLGVECEVVHFDTREYAATHRVSIEMAARELRYREFERIRRAQRLDVIAVAHHQDDAVETLLLNLIRGAGIDGLTGMKVKNGHVVRPLLCLTRDELTDYLDALQQPYVTDSTNLTDDYARNKVRLQLLPMMQQVNPAAKENIAHAASHLAEAAVLFHKAVDEVKRRIVTDCPDGLDISIPALLNTDVPGTLLFEILKPCGFNSSQVTHIFRSLTSGTGRVFCTGTHTALTDRGLLRVRENKERVLPEELYTLPEEGLLRLPDGTSLSVHRFVPETGWQIPKRSDAIYIDAERLHEPLTVRHPKEGDRFSPFGMRGTKLLSDFYTDIKLPRTEKKRQWLLCHADDIVWAVGSRSSERYRINGTEKHIICIETDNTHK